MRQENEDSTQVFIHSPIDKTHWGQKFTEGQEQKTFGRLKWQTPIFGDFEVVSALNLFDYIFSEKLNLFSEYCLIECTYVTDASS